jgi:hypothetical protein
LILIKQKHQFICFSILFLGIIANQVYAQTFDRVEILAELSILEENNGAAVADYDGDLDLDIFVVAKGKEQAGVEKSFSRLFRNNNDGSFTDVTTQAGLTNLFVLNVDTGFASEALDGWKYGVSWGDYDNDGFPDLFFTYVDKVQLFHNNTDGTFSDVTQSAGIVGKNLCTNTGATWFDFNNDGFLDLFINDWGKCSSNTLYQNNGNGTFTNVTISTGINLVQSVESYTVIPFDFNNDGFKDIYVSNDFAAKNTLFINQNGTAFSEQAAAYGLESTLNSNDMAISINDFDNDGDFDFFTTGINQNIIFKNNGTNNFSESFIPSNGWAWGQTFGDFDLDGDEDIILVNGYKSQENERNTYLKNLTIEGQYGNGTFFDDDTSRSGLGEMTESTHAEVFDYDSDGDLDVLVTNAGQPSFFYENTTLDINKSSNLKWFKVSLQGTVSNRDAIGTTVSITTNNGTFNRYYTGVGFVSQNLQPVHFGLPASSQINELKITWPSGLIETHQNLTVNTIIKATEGQGYQVLNILPSQKILGCTDPNSCNYNPIATKNDGNCQYITPTDISGPTNSGLNNTETYSYVLDMGSSANWFVEGGEIISGQGSGSIEVKWGLESSGKVGVIERTNGCTSLLKELDVTLSLNNVSENISIARIWNEALLEAIRKDFARPTVHARNLFHTSIALYDAWAIYDKVAAPYLVGNTVHDFQSELKVFVPTESTEVSMKKAMSYAAYRLLSYRFKISPGSRESLQRFNLVMSQLGYNINETSVDYESGNAAALGNYIAQVIIDYGEVDGSNESNLYGNSFYQPVNPALKLSLPNEPTGIMNPNRWQPLSFRTFIDQSGNLISGSTSSFLGPEWGAVFPFALSENDKSIKQRNGDDYEVYLDPGTPPQLDVVNQTASSDLYKWNFSLVSMWSSHLDPADGVMWDISPKTIGNIDIESIPESFSDYKSYYNELDGGDISKGHTVNPVTGQPYQTQMVPRADYTRVLAEFWADGPDSETPPGHWFTILNYVNDHPLISKKFNGQGDILSPLEWDVKTYFVLSGAMHDAAITAWGIKGWHDYIRPISAIRYMAELGQSTDSNLPNYHVGGIPLKDGFVEQIQTGDPLSGSSDENVGKIKLYAWKGHDFISNSDTDVAGVGWILASNWWPYQRPSFVTPPFAGYISGHSTFSRAAAEVMTLITGDAFFPGGMGEFVAKKDNFLVFEKGPSVDVVLQWATYRDASDQTSLSRIWGGIHPPADDLPGRLIGAKIGVEAYDFAIPYFTGGRNNASENDIVVYPNPVIKHEVHISNTQALDEIYMFDIQGRLIQILDRKYNDSNGTTFLKLPESTSPGLYVIKVNGKSKMIVIRS